MSYRLADVMQATPSQDDLISLRREAMSIMARGTETELSHGLQNIRSLPPIDDIRAPESGLVMIRGRVGGDGDAFNLGEATVSRAAVQLASGEIGIGYVLGRDVAKARMIAVCDALIQHLDYRHAVQRHVIEPIDQRRRAEAIVAAERTAATRVDFFTLVRGED